MQYKLQEQYLKNGTFSRVLTFTIVILHLESPSLYSETAVFMPIEAVPQIRFCHSSISFRSRNSRLQKLHSIILVPTCSTYSISRPSDAFVLSHIHRLSSKNEVAIYLVQAAISIAGQRHTVPLATTANIATGHCLATQTPRYSCFWAF